MSKTPFFVTTLDLPTPLFLWENSEPSPLFGEILETQSPRFIIRVWAGGGRGWGFQL